MWKLSDIVHAFHSIAHSSSCLQTVYPLLILSTSCYNYLRSIWRRTLMAFFRLLSLSRVLQLGYTWLQFSKSETLHSKPAALNSKNIALILANFQFLRISTNPSQCSLVVPLATKIMPSCHSVLPGSQLKFFEEPPAPLLSLRVHIRNDFLPLPSHLRSVLRNAVTYFSPTSLSETRILRQFLLPKYWFLVFCVFDWNSFVWTVQIRPVHLIFDDLF